MYEDVGVGVWPELPAASDLTSSQLGRFRNAIPSRSSSFHHHDADVRQRVDDLSIQEHPGYDVKFVDAKAGSSDQTGWDGLG